MARQFGYIDDEYIGSAVVVDLFHYAVHEGIAYVTEHSAVIGSGSSIALSFKTASGTDNDIHFLFSARGNKEANVQVLEGCTATMSTGTPNPVYNRERNSANTIAVRGHDTGAWVAGSVTADGTIAGGVPVYTEHFGAGRNAGFMNADHELVLKRDTEYCILLTSETVANDCELILDMFAVPRS